LLIEKAAKTFPDAQNVEENIDDETTCDGAKARCTENNLVLDGVTLSFYTNQKCNGQ
jgi:hypothetical protein